MDTATLYMVVTLPNGEQSTRPWDTRLWRAVSRDDYYLTQEECFLKAQTVLRRRADDIVKRQSDCGEEFETQTPMMPK
ncbi:MAG: hypothetical protein ACXVA6_22665 [Isosphaeraceae bacterium]